MTNSFDVAVAIYRWTKISVSAMVIFISVSKLLV